MKIEFSFEKLGITDLNEMQKNVICHENSTQDILLLSPTGTGKTLGYSLLFKNSIQAIKSTQILVIVPTRELAIQIETVLKSVFPSLFVTSIYGGRNMLVEKRRLDENPTIVVGTPGRIIDHLQRGRLQNNSIHTLVMDEYDKSLELGFLDQIEEINRLLDRPTRKILASATQLKKVPDFINLDTTLQLNYLHLKVNQSVLHLSQVVAEAKNKFKALVQIFVKYPVNKTLVFCNHREAVERISDYLHELEIEHDTFHGGLDQTERELALVKFRNNSTRILITTDLAARGLDIAEVDLIVHYQLPINEEAFTHRNGRTARVDREGKAIIIMTPEEYFPEYFPNDIDIEELEGRLEDYIPNSEYISLRLSLGKREKIRKIDIVGFLLSFEGMHKNDLGAIDITEKESYVAVKKEVARSLLRQANREKIKGKIVRVYMI